MARGVSGQVLAVEVDIGQGKTSWIGETLNEPLTLTGKLTQATNQAIDPAMTALIGVSVSDTKSQGSLINRADIVMTSDGRSIRAFAVDPFGFRNGTSTPSTITGDLIQAGNITMNNGGYEGFEIGDAVIGGSISNSGTIKSTPVVLGTSAFGGTVVGEGMFLHYTQVAGDVANTGVIEMTGDELVALAVDGPSDYPINIGGKIINSGTITATGKRAWGIEVETTTSALRIENIGLLSVDGAGASGIVFYAGTVDYILNTGTVEAKGTNANAFDLLGATFIQNSATGSRGIINRGTITADGTAISVDGAEQTSVFEINQQAGEILSNSGIAIDAANRASLNWTGGKIVGDVLNVNAVNIAGQAGFFR